MITTVRADRNNPCKGCPDRYPACSDHCTKDAFLKWKAEQDLIRKNRKAYNEGCWYREEPYEKRAPLKPRRRK